MELLWILGVLVALFFAATYVWRKRGIEIMKWWRGRKKEGQEVKSDESPEEQGGEFSPIQIERTSGIVRWLGELVVAFFGALGVGVFLLTNDPWLGISAALVCCTILGVFSVRIVKQTDVWCIERIGRYHRILRPGLNFILPVVDKLAEKGLLSLKEQALDLYADEPENQYDFTDASAPVSVTVYYKLRTTNKNRDALESSVYRFIYGNVDPEKLLKDTLDNNIRPALQLLSIDEAQKAKSAQAVTARDELNGSTVPDRTGVVVSRVLITDIALPDAVTRLRERRLEGTTEAQKTVSEADGYGKAITGIMAAARKAGSEITFQEAVAIFQTQRGMDTIARTGANVTLVGRDTDAVLKTLEIGGKK